MILLAVVAIGIGTTSAYAITSTGPYSTDTNTSHSCGTNFSNSVEYSCAAAYSNGNGALLAKANGFYGTTAEAEFQMGSVEFTTTNNKVTFNVIMDVVGTIEEPSGSYVTVIYGAELQKKSWWGSWSTAGYCNNIKYTDGDVSVYNQKIQCVKNSGSGTYKVIAYAETVAQTRGTDSSVYADFYTGSNRIVTDSISGW